jgi:hypothetical protein
MKQIRQIEKSVFPSQSTFLVSEKFLIRFINPRALKGKKLAAYLHRLLFDSQLFYKLSFLDSQKWKKVYQSEGQNLQRLDFLPDESDWARLSIISNSTGYSRCYLFVYLMLIDMGVIKLAEYGTPYRIVRKTQPYEFYCDISLDEKLKLLRRTLKM